MSCRFDELNTWCNIVDVLLDVGGNMISVLDQLCSMWEGRRRQAQHTHRRRHGHHQKARGRTRGS